jgi:hypothetical protein
MPRRAYPTSSARRRPGSRVHDPGGRNPGSDDFAAASGSPNRPPRHSPRPRVDASLRGSFEFFVVALKGRVHAVPFLWDEDGNIILKTIYPSRKLQRRYGKT